MEGHGESPRIKKAPPLAGHAAETVRDASTAQFGTLPQPLRRSLTWDQGWEMSQHAPLRVQIGLAVWTCTSSRWCRRLRSNRRGSGAVTRSGIAATARPLDIFLDQLAAASCDDAPYGLNERY
jgi:hypothetical protein